MLHTFTFSCIDNGSKHQVFTVKAADKAEAIKNGFARAKKHAAGDITSWDCTFVRYFG